MVINDYVRDSVFSYCPAVISKDGGVFADEYWWAPVAGGGEGYIILWADGTHHHTYRSPEGMYDDNVYVVKLADDGLDSV